MQAVAIAGHGGFNSTSLVSPHGIACLPGTSIAYVADTGCAALRRLDVSAHDAEVTSFLADEPSVDVPVLLNQTWTAPASYAMQVGSPIRSGTC